MIIVVHRLDDERCIVCTDKNANPVMDKKLLENPFGGEYLAAFFGKDKETIKEAIEAAFPEYDEEEDDDDD